MPKIFISYRRADTIDVAGRIFDRLVQAFGHGHVFKDVDSIPFGEEFASVISARLRGCDVVIVLIGRSWLAARDQGGSLRLLNRGDYVRIEIEQALNCGARVIPALVGNAAMPREEQLPGSLRRLVAKHAITIRPDPDFHRDMDRLVAALRERDEQSQAPEASGPGKANGGVGVVAALTDCACGWAFILVAMLELQVCGLRGIGARHVASLSSWLPPVVVLLLFAAVLVHKVVMIAIR